MQQGGGKAGREGRCVRLCDADPTRNHVGARGDVRQCRVHPQKVDAQGVSAWRWLHRRRELWLEGSRKGASQLGSDGALAPTQHCASFGTRHFSTHAKISLIDFPSSTSPLQAPPFSPLSPSSLDLSCRKFSSPAGRQRAGPHRVPQFWVQDRVA